MALLPASCSVLSPELSSYTYIYLYTYIPIYAYTFIFLASPTSQIELNGKLTGKENRKTIDCMFKMGTIKSYLGKSAI